MGGGDPGAEDIAADAGVGGGVDPPEVRERMIQMFSARANISAPKIPTPHQSRVKTMSAIEPTVRQSAMPYRSGATRLGRGVWRTRRNEAVLTVVRRDWVRGDPTRSVTGRVPAPSRAR